MPHYSEPQRGSSVAADVRLGIAVTTIGRWSWLRELVDSLSASTTPPVAMVVADQSGGPVPDWLGDVNWLRVVTSSGGASRGRNEAIAALVEDDADIDVVAIPNDHTTFRPDTISAVSDCFRSALRPDVIAGVLLEPGGVRFNLPPTGMILNRRTVWRAIEPAIFLSLEVARMGFAEDIGPGADSAWQAGDGTDLLLRAMAAGKRVVACREVVLSGRGDRRSLDDEQWRMKQRGYARGTGYVMRLHHAGAFESAVHIASPLYRLMVPLPTGERLSLRSCTDLMLGRAEGRLGRPSKLRPIGVTGDALLK